MPKPNAKALVSRGQTHRIPQSCHCSKNFWNISEIASKDFSTFLLYILSQEKLHSLYTALVNQYFFFFFLVLYQWSLQDPETDSVGWLTIWVLCFQLWSNIWTMAVSLRCMICIVWWCPSFMAHWCMWAQAYSVGHCHIQERDYTGSLHKPAPSWVHYMGNVCSGHSFRASASNCKHMKKTTYILTVTPSSPEFNKRPHVPFPLRCPRNSDVMKNRQQ